MGFFSNLYDKARNFIMSLLPVQDIEKKMGVKFRDMGDMPSAITAWRDAYQGTPSWLTAARGRSLNVAAVVCADIAKKSVSELEITASVGESADELTAAFLTGSIMPFLRREVEYSLAMGGVVARPWYDADAKKIRIGWYTADMILPTAWDGKRMTGCVLIDREVVESGGTQTVYTKLEAHELLPTGVCIIRTKLFKQVGTNSELGVEVPLAVIPKWATITQEVMITGVTEPLFVYMGTPWANTIALGNPTGVSLFAQAMATLEEIDLAYSSLRWERESGEAKIFLDDSMIPTKTVTRNGGGKQTVDDLSEVERRMYRKLTGSPDGKSLFERWSPELRVDAYIMLIKTNLSLFCMQCGLDAGAYIFDAETGAITAAEVRSKRQRTYGTIVDVQAQMIEPSILALVNAVRYLQTLYDLPEFPTPDQLELGFAFGDSVLVDEETDRANAQSEVTQGLRSKLSYLTEYRGMTEQEAQDEIARIKADTPVATSFFGV